MESLELPCGHSLHQSDRSSPLCPLVPSCPRSGTRSDHARPRLGTQVPNLIRLIVFSNLIPDRTMLIQRLDETGLNEVSVRCGVGTSYGPACRDPHRQSR